jgi:outer membrane protein assembly factor BamB
VNATAVVLGDLVIVATIVNSAVAYETATGRLVWRRRLDSPSIYELLSWKGSALVQTSKSLYLLHPKSGEVLHRWHWRGKEVRAVAVAENVLLIVTEQKGASSASTGGSAQYKIEIKCLREDEVIFDGLTSESVRGVRWSQETGLFYIPSSDGLFILDTGNGGHIEEIRNNEGLLYPGLPDIKDGVIYMLGRDKTLYALRHP